jgi:hypothetical protein
VAAPPVSGAIFTTAVDGSIVNANVQYATKCDVYLNGGPGPHAPAKAAGLPSGDYYFQVTDPSGQTLLSTDAVANRKFHVNSSGVIDAYTGSGGPVHPTGTSIDHPEAGSITIRLANTTCLSDFLNTSNGGGVYKVWATPASDFTGDPTSVDSPCGNGCFHGFTPSKSKTDNFKVTPTTATFCLSVTKKLMDFDGVITPGTSWPIHIMDSLGVTTTVFTSDTGTLTKCGLVAGTYTVSEDLQVAGLNTNVVGLSVNGATLPAQSIYAFLWTVKSPDPFVIVFTNQQQITPQ